MRPISFSAFEWDPHNLDKCTAHGVSVTEIESVFEHAVSVERDPFDAERRFRAIGRTATGRFVFLVSTLREREAGVLIRAISARYMHQREVRRYESQEDSRAADGS